MSGYKVKYDVEKVLYLASQEKMLNVSVTEKSDTDLSQRVRTLQHAGCLVMVPHADMTNYYYKITDKGMVHLLTMQLATRTKLRKPTDLHEFKLLELKTKLGM